MEEIIKKLKEMNEKLEKMTTELQTTLNKIKDESRYK
jgi:hypothetical protein